MIAVTPRAVLFAPGRYFVHPAFDYLLVGGGLSLVFAVARRLAPRSFAWRRPPYEFERKRLPFDIICGTGEIRTAIERRRPLTEIERAWTRGLHAWMRARARYLMY